MGINPAKVDKVVAKVPLTHYRGVSVVVMVDKKGIYLAFEENGLWTTNAPICWWLSPEDTIKIANAFSEASLYTK